MTGRNRRLRQLLAEPEELVVPGVHDALSARLAEEAGWPALYVGSYATSAVQAALPDTGFLGLRDMLGAASTVLSATADAPVIADAEGGFGDATTVWRTVEAFERLGVSGIHLEDHAFGKHLPVEGRLVDVDEMRAKLEVALEARRDPDFVIIARTDAGWLPGCGGLPEAVARATTYAELGADLVFLAVVPDTELAGHHDELGGLPLCTVDWSPLLDPSRVTDRPGRLVATGPLDVRVRLCYFHLLHAAYSGVRQMLDALARGTSAAELAALGLVDEHELESLLGVERVVAAHHRRRGPR